MADFRAVHSVGNSVITYLRNAYPLGDEIAAEFALLSSGEMTTDFSPTKTVSLYLYRININEHLRNRGSVGNASDARSPLSLDLHYLLTAWSNNAAEEQLLLAWAMRQLYDIPVLDVSSLSPEGGWTSGDVVHWIPAEMTHEDMTRIWGALNPPYRLSFPYIARVVRIDPVTDMPSGKPVVASRFGFTEQTPARPRT
jgi:hypothetical protein